jgi:hypothetical protein
MPGGLVARANKGTQSERLPAATPFDKLRINRAVRRRADPFWPITASLVGLYTLAWLPPYSLHSAKIGSVKAVQTNVIPL